jgi:hypothetical protein
MLILVLSQKDCSKLAALRQHRYNVCSNYTDTVYLDNYIFRLIFPTHGCKHSRHFESHSNWVTKHPDTDSLFVLRLFTDSVLTADIICSWTDHNEG